MIELVCIKPTEMTEADSYWLADCAVRTTWRKVLARQVYNSALKGEVGLYRISGGAEGLLIVDKDEDMLIVTSLAGKGLLREMQAIREKLLVLAASFGCSKLAGYIERPGLWKLFQAKTPAKPTMIMFVEPVL